MKKFVYIYALICFILSSCETNELGSPVEETNKTTMHFTLSIPDYKIAQNTRSASYENAVNNMWLMVFDTNGLFLGRVQATNLVSEENAGIGTGSFEAQVPSNAGIIHFIGNCNQMENFDDMAAYQKDEREIIPALSSNTMAFWGRNVITSLSNPVSVLLYRNQAKVTVENQGATNFTLTGYAVCNYITTGTIAPFNPETMPTPFVLLEGVPTVPQGTLSYGSQTDSDCDLTVKYMFANPNYFNDQTYVIIKGRLNGGSTDLYYKIQLLDSDQQPYPVVRNYTYRIVIRSFSDNANGSTSFSEAMNAAPSNNLYADIFKDSPTISDDKNNVLALGSVNQLFVQGGTLNVSADYYQNGTLSNSLIEVSVAEDQGSIISALSYNSSTGMVTANVQQILVGQQQASIVVKAGVLSRTITVISSELYSFAPATFSPAVYTSRDELMTLNFIIPNTIPSYMFPLECIITTKNLYPVSPNQDLEVNLSSGGYSYSYWATGSGTVSLNFKTGFENSDETVTIQNKYFTTASVPLQARHFTNVSINSRTNLVNYGSGNTATYTFTISDIASSPVTYPLTVLISTTNLTTTQSGWTAVSGGYSHTYTSALSGAQTVQFTSNKAVSAEDVIISANGFSPTTISYDNVLGSRVHVGNNINVYANGTYYTLPRYTITSSNTTDVPNFTTSSSSAYSFYIAAGAKLSDTVTFNYSGYYGSYTIEQLLLSPRIILQQ